MLELGEEEGEEEGQASEEGGQRRNDTKVPNRRPRKAVNRSSLFDLNQGMRFNMHLRRFPGNRTVYGEKSVARLEFKLMWYGILPTVLL